MDDVRAASGVIDPVSRGPEVPEEERLRAEIYGVLARLLAAPPEAALLKALARMSGDDSGLGAAFRDLARAAAGATAETVEHEYHDLFIGVDRGELLPYASFYLTGFLHEKPLAELRGELIALGVERAVEVKEPEDHIAALCEVMAGLITGAFGVPAPIETQQRFFDAFLKPWAGRFFHDLEVAQAAHLYAPVGRIGRLFFDVEQTAFAIA
jgi:TorA maturation chaperone TorD